MLLFNSIVDTPSTRLNARARPQVELSLLGLDDARFSLNCSLVKLEYRRRKYAEQVAAREKAMTRSCTRWFKNKLVAFKAKSKSLFNCEPKKAKGKVCERVSTRPSFEAAELPKDPRMLYCYVNVPSGEIKKVLKQPVLKAPYPRPEAEQTAPKKRKMMKFVPKEDFDAPTSSKCSTASPPKKKKKKPPILLSGRHPQDMPTLGNWHCAKDRGGHAHVESQLVRPPSTISGTSTSSTSTLRSMLSQISTSSAATLKSVSSVVSATLVPLVNTGAKLVLVPLKVTEIVLRTAGLSFPAQEEEPDDEYFYDMHGRLWTGFAASMSAAALHDEMNRERSDMIRQG